MKCLKMLCLKRLLNILLVMKVGQSLTIYQPNKGAAIIPLVTAHADHNSIYPMINRWTNFKTNEQPAVAADGLKKDELYNIKTTMRQEPLFTNYHNMIYHHQGIKRASPLANNKHGQNERFNVRNQRNLRENHDKKVIEQKSEEVENVNEDSEPQSSESESLRDSLKQPSTTTSRAIRYSHDIFLNYPKSHHVNFGHIELSPVVFKKHFESQKAGNRYRGEITWLDNNGGFAQHYWDLAQGRLLKK